MCAQNFSKYVTKTKLGYEYPDHYVHKTLYFIANINILF